MKIDGRVTVATPLADAWTRINDPRVMERCVPGLESLEQKGKSHYDAVLDLKLSALQGRFSGSLDFLERRAPDFLHVRVQGKGGAGFVDADVELQLAETDEGTEFRYETDVLLGGQVGRLGERTTSGLTRELAGQFFEAFEHWESDASTKAAHPPAWAFLRLLWRALLRVFGLSRRI